MARLFSDDQFSGILKTASLLIFVGTCITIILGASLNAMNVEKKTLTEFLSFTQNVQIDFERSLTMYTENTKEDIAFLHSLRPTSELDYIAFIDAVEDLAKESSMNINLESVDSSAIASTGIESNSLDYQVTFFGSKNQLLNFLKGLESLPYYLHVQSISYTSLSSVDSTSTSPSTSPNIELIIKLYVK